MTDSIVCPNCKKPIPLTQALTHQMNEQMQQKLFEVQRKGEEERAKLIEQAKLRIVEEKEKSRKEAEVSLRQKIAEEMELKIKDTQNESEELKKEKKLMQEQLLELNKTMRQIQNQSREKELELTKRFTEQEDKFRKEEQKRAEEQFKFMILEKDKKLEAVIKANEDLKRKLEQGSQQTQGEVLEDEVERMLRKEFPFDEINPVPKGKMGADIIQVVKKSNGKVCGTIIWEMKRTKTWGGDWIEKLKTDQRSINAEVAVIVSQNVPDTIKRFGLMDGVWVCEFDCMNGIAYSLRNQLMELQTAKSMMDGQNGKMDLLYKYITSTEFKHRVEAIMETFSNMKSEIEKEQNFFAKKWAREEKYLRNVLDNTLGMHGDLQGIMGKSIAELKGMEELPEKISTDAVDGETPDRLF